MRVRAVVAALFVSLVAGCGGSEAVARVGTEKISETDVERVLEHFEEEFKREGREFPADGSPQHRALEKSVLGYIVFRSQLQQAAAQLGVRVSEGELERRLKRAEEGGQESEGEAGQAYFETATLIQLLREKVAVRLGRGIDGLTTWTAKARKEFPAEYEEGWAP
jgi:SurA-like protein